MKYLKKFEGIFSDRYKEEDKDTEGWNSNMFTSRLKDLDDKDKDVSVFSHLADDTFDNPKTNFDIQFAMSKIKENYSEDKVTEMYDEEILEWVDDDWQDDYESEYDWYIDHNNGEAQDSIVDQVISWFKRTYNQELSDSDHCDLFDAIKEEYSVLN